MTKFKEQIRRAAAESEDDLVNEVYAIAAGPLYERVWSPSHNPLEVAEKAMAALREELEFLPFDRRYGLQRSLAKCVKEVWA